ncbi:MAG: flavodoxin family protein [Methanocorpusculum sp.]|nr:flavodoxin family protein [Methanocorpusculum sp.]
MKKILILSASPRKGGNSDILCDEFIRGANEAGNKPEKIFLREKKIGCCIACDYCKENAGKCSQNDDMAEILEKMIAADVIVLATPVYFYTMSAQLKTVIDRTVARYTEITGKEFYFIVTAADTSKANMQKTIDGLRGFTEMCLDGAVEKGVILGTGAWQAGEIRRTPAMKEAYTMGKKV